MKISNIINQLYAVASAADTNGLFKLADNIDRIAMSIIDEKLRDRPILISEMPDWEEDGGYNNIINLLKQATPEEIDFWKNWYSNARQDVEALANKYNEPFHVVAGIVAVLSPGNKWKGNIRAAESLLKEVHNEEEGAVGSDAKKTNKTDTSDIYQDFLREESPVNIGYGKVNAYPENTSKARDILITGNVEKYITGPKVSVFYQSLVDPQSTSKHMVLDGHAINIWRGVKVPLKGIRTPNESERSQMLADYARAAADTELSVQEVQAITWFLWKSALNG